MRILLTLAVSGALVFGIAACVDDEEPSGAGAAASEGGELSGTISIDGSSTVAPFA